jgi:hypothetical protein
MSLVAPVTITLHGLPPTDAVTNVPPPESSNGTISSVTGQTNIHGHRFLRTGLVLLTPAIDPGDSVLMLQHAINWEPAGQEVVLDTTAMEDSRKRHCDVVAMVKNVILNPSAGVGLSISNNLPSINTLPIIENRACNRLTGSLKEC